MTFLRPLALLGIVGLACSGPARQDAQIRDRGVARDRANPAPDQPLGHDGPHQCFPYEIPSPKYDHQCAGNVGCTELPLKKCQCACAWCNDERCVRGICDDSCLPPPFVDVGKPCASASECSVNGICLLTAQTSGFCTTECTVDDPQTLVNEDSCPNLAVNVCVRVELTGGTTKGFCLRTCTPSLSVNSCTPPLACLPESGHRLGLLDRAACAFPGCASGEHCPIILATPCDVATKPCPAGQTCERLAYNTTEGRCALPGKCVTATGLCEPKQSSGTGKVGDPCSSDLDCAAPGTCMAEETPQKWLKATGEPCSHGAECCSAACEAGKCKPGSCTTVYRNGYCTIVGCTFASTYSPGTCPPNSICNRLHPGGHCQRSCDPYTASSCRGLATDKLGDYECRDWSRTPITATLAVADGPVCDYGPAVRCGMTKPVVAPCAQLGTITNATQMSCRTLADQVLAPSDPLGYCLDNTASGAAP